VVVTALTFQMWRAAIQRTELTIEGGEPEEVTRGKRKVKQGEV